MVSNWFGSSIRLVLPRLQLTKFYNQPMRDLEIFERASNLTEVVCDFQPLHEFLFHEIIHTRLTSLTVTEGVSQIFTYLTLPALQHLDISSDYRCDNLETFLMRSSPPLVSLAALAADEDFNWARCLAPVARTLENIHFGYPSPEVISTLFDILSPSSLPHIRALSLDEIDPEDVLDYEKLVRFLYLCSSDSAHLRSFRLLWQYSPFWDKKCYGPDQKPLDTITGHLSRLAQVGMDIHLGTKNKNYAPVHRQMRNSGGAEEDVR
ncbi:hypothetical protein K438DRAFT_1985555 [Mycena galopus ATCC 62051]|nr:hypothetical protein K438DRAFT_1985555 [Mycena galopus ATCC 62051]